MDPSMIRPESILAKVKDPQRIFHADIG